MPSIREPSTVEAVAQAFTSNGRKQEQAMITAGYSKAYANSYCGKLWEDKRLIDAIARIDAKTAVILDWNRTTNLKHQHKQIARYEAILTKHPDNLQAMQGLNQVLRELNASSGQHSSSLDLGHTDSPAELTQAQAEQYDRMANIKLAQDTA